MTYSVHLTSRSSLIQILDVRIRFLVEDFRLLGEDLLMRSLLMHHLVESNLVLYLRFYIIVLLGSRVSLGLVNGVMGWLIRLSRVIIPLCRLKSIVTTFALLLFVLSCGT